MTVKTWADNGVASDQLLRDGIEESRPLLKCQAGRYYFQVADSTLCVK